MRRLTLTLVAALLVASADAASAQSSLKGGFRGGLNAGTSNVEGLLFSQSTGARTGIHAGILGKYGISRNFAVQFEAMYSQKGFGTGDGDIALSLDYVEIPVYGVVEIPGKISPHLLLGIVLGLETSCKVTTAVADNAPCDDVSAGPRTKGADSGLLFGLGVSVDFGPGAVFFDAVYNYGLTDISEPSNNVDSIKTRTFYGSVGYLFNLGATSE